MRVLDLFSGIGGFSISLERSGMETVAFCEYDDHARNVLAKRWPDVPIYEDVRTLTGNLLRQDGITNIDMICGGPPCQDISFAGYGAGINGSRSGLWAEFLRLVGDIRPSWAIMENVAALPLRGLGIILGAFTEIGYDAEWDVISSAQFGAPHLRERTWLVAYPKRIGQPGSRRLEYAINPASDSYREASGLVHAFQRQALPYVCRRHDGVSNGSHRLHQLGNAIDPNIPEMIGRAIMEVERNAATSTSGTGSTDRCGTGGVFPA